MADKPLYDRLLGGDEAAFRQLVRQLHGSLVGVARSFVGTPAAAEEVVQDTWVAVLEGLAGFEQRASLKNWIFAILINKARSRGQRDNRMLAVSDSLDASDTNEFALGDGRFDQRGSWTVPPLLWDEVTPERVVGGRQLLAHVAAAIERLPDEQKTVLIMHDVEGLEARDICSNLQISEANRRVLLHRARLRLRQVLDDLVGRR